MTPDEHTNQEFFLSVGGGHQLYVHDWGNQQAPDPIIFLHGGPGSSSKDGHKHIFSPEQHRVIFFDQRSCGKSLPYGSLDHNTLDDLIADIEMLAAHFKLSSLVIQGSSWGSCLALAYALKHPKRVKALVLQGIFTGTTAEIDWIFKGQFRPFFPDVWERYLAATPSKYHADPSAYHLKTILSSDEGAMRASALALTTLEAAVMTLDDRYSPPDPETFDPTYAKIFAHYFTNNCFMPDRHILNNAHKLTMPVWIAQGRYDMDCPPITAYELHQKLPNSNLIWTVANHRGSERETHSVMRTILLQFGAKQ
jgi:proline iminopeptidase